MTKMLKETKNKIILQLNNINNKYNLKYYKDIYIKLNKEYKQKKDDHEVYIDNYYNNLRNNNKSIFDDEPQEFRNESQKQFNYINLLQYSIIAYKNIIINMLYYVFKEVFMLMLESVKNERDFNEFKKILELYDDENKKYIYDFRIYKRNEDCFAIIVTNNYYYELEKGFYLSTIYTADGLKAENKKQFENFINYNNKDFETFKKDCYADDITALKKQVKKILNVANAENMKIKDQIIKSNEKINNINIYGLEVYKYKEN